MASPPFNKGMRPSKRAADNAADQKTINRMTTSRRLGRVKVRMPEFKCLADKDDDEEASDER